MILGQSTLQQLNYQGAVTIEREVVQLLQAGDDSRKIHLAPADGDFFAQRSRIRRPEPVFGMDALDMWREDLDRVHRIGFAIEDEVREIEVDALIVETDVLHRAH